MLGKANDWHHLLPQVHVAVTCRVRVCNHSFKLPVKSLHSVDNGLQFYEGAKCCRLLVFKTGYTVTPQDLTRRPARQTTARESRDCAAQNRSHHRGDNVCPVDASGVLINALPPDHFSAPLIDACASGVRPLRHFPRCQRRSHSFLPVPPETAPPAPRADR